MSPQKLRLLFVCTGNCCRSQMAEAIARHVAADQFEVYSCGAVAAGFVHPLALATLDAMVISADGLESKGWGVFAEQALDIVITVCDDAAADCPVFPGEGLVVHWPLPDPSFAPGTDEERLASCMRVAERIKLKVERMSAIVARGLPREELEQELVQLADL